MPKWQREIFPLEKFVFYATKDRISHLSERSKERICKFFQSTIVGGFIGWLEGNLAQPPNEIASEFTENFEAVLPALIQRFEKMN